MKIVPFLFFLCIHVYLSRGATQLSCTTTGTPPTIVQYNSTTDRMTVFQNQTVVFSSTLQSTILLETVRWSIFSDSGNMDIKYAGREAIGNSLKFLNLVLGVGGDDCTVFSQLLSQSNNARVVANVTLTFSSSIVQSDAINTSLSVVPYVVSVVPLDPPSTPDTYYFTTVQFDNVPSQDALVGFGEQYNQLDLRNNVIPIITREQGLGRGLQPLTYLLNTFGNYTGGSPWTNYAARPILISSSGVVFLQENSYYSEFDTTVHSKEDNLGALRYSINATRMYGVVGSFATLPTAVAAVTKYLGVPPPPPRWSYAGAIVGLQGGTEAVLGNFTKLASLGCPVAAMWMQDWTGVRQLDLRQGLWWTWVWDPRHYPDYENMIRTLRNSSMGTRTMTYINSMLVNATGFLPPGAPNYYDEAYRNGYFIRSNNNATPWVGYNGASMIDFTNPAAKAWYKSIIQQNILNTGVSGWMADFGESVPLDGFLSDPSIDIAAYHNAYPDEWFRLNREAVHDSNADGEAFFFGRSAWLRSHALYSSGWQGDQLCDFDDDDGIGSAVTSLVTSGLSGTLFQHSDTGGYNTIWWYKRTEELFYRWCELSAFSFLLRTHEGSDPHKNWQFYSNEDGYRNFTTYTQVYVAWIGYRETLVQEALRRYYPIVRPLLFHYPKEVNIVRNVHHQYLVGDTILVAPVTTKGARSVNVYFPSGEVWVHVWSNMSVPGGEWRLVGAKVGCPAVFVRSSSSWTPQLLHNFTRVMTCSLE